MFNRARLARINHLLGVMRLPNPAPAAIQPEAEVDIPHDDYIERELAARIQSRRLLAVQSIFPRLTRDKYSWTNIRGQTFLHIALQHYQTEVFEWLYERFENHPLLLKKDKNNRSLVWLATKRQNLDLVARLLHHQITNEKFKDLPESASWLESDKQNVSLLHLAAQYPSTDFLDFFLPILKDKNPFIAMFDQQDHEGKSPLHYACEAKSYDNIALLIQLDADLYLLDKKQNHFFSWLEKNETPEDEKNKIDLVKRLDHQKQLQILSYFRSRSEKDAPNPVFLKLEKELDAALFQPDLKTELDQFEKTHIKSASQCLDEDRVAIVRLQKMVTDRIGQFSARPAPVITVSPLNRMVSTFFRHAAAVLVGAIPTYFVFMLVLPPSAILSLVGITTAALTAASFLVLATAYLIIPIAMIALCIVFFRVAAIYSQPSIPPPVRISHEEIADISDSLHEHAIKKYNALQAKGLAGDLPIDSDKFSILSNFISFAKGAPSFAVDDVIRKLKALNQNLEIFLKAMMNRKKPLSRSVAQVPVSLASPTSELLETASTKSALDSSTSVADNWATLHTSKKEIVSEEEENTDVSDLEMAHSAFGVKHEHP